MMVYGDRYLDRPPEEQQAFVAAVAKLSSQRKGESIGQKAKRYLRAGGWDVLKGFAQARYLGDFDKLEASENFLSALQQAASTGEANDPWLWRKGLGPALRTVPGVGASVGAALIGARIAGPTGAKVGVTLPMFPSIWVETYGEMRREGMSRRLSKGLSLPSAIVETAIESYLPIPGMKGKVGAPVRGIMGKVRRVVTRALIDTAKETGEEAGQAFNRELWKQIGRGVDADLEMKPLVSPVLEAAKATYESVLPTLMVVGPMGAVGGARGFEGDPKTIIQTEDFARIYSQIQPDDAAELAGLDHVPSREELRVRGIPGGKGIGIPERAELQRRLREVVPQTAAPTGQEAVPPSPAESAAGPVVQPEPARSPKPLEFITAFESAGLAREFRAADELAEQAITQARGPQAAQAAALPLAEAIAPEAAQEPALPPGPPVAAPGPPTEITRAPGPGPETVSIKNAATEARREDLGLSPRVPVEPHPWAAAQAEAARASNQEIDSLLAEVREKPRALFDTESAMLLRRQHELEREHTEALRRKDDQAATEVETRLADLYGIDEAVGAEGGRSLAFRAAEVPLAEDFSTAGLVRRRIEAKGGRPLDPAERTHIQEQAQRIADLEGQLQQHVTERQQEALDREIEAAKQDVAARRRETIEARTERWFTIAAEHGVDRAELRAEAEQRAAAEAEYAREYNQAYRAVVKATKLSAAKIEKIRNQGGDPATLPRLDEEAAILAREYPVLGIQSEPADVEQKQDYVQALVEVIDRGPRPEPQWHDKLEEVASEMSRAKGRPIPADRGDAWESELLFREGERDPWEQQEPKGKPLVRGKGPSARRQAAQQAVTEAWGNFKRVSTGKVFANPLDPELLGAAVQVGKAYIDLGVVRFSEFWSHAAVSLGKDAEKLRETFRAAWDSLQVPAKEIDPTNQAVISKLAKTILREVVATGTVEREAATDAVHEELQTILPDWNRRDTQGAITGEGLRQELAKDPVSVRYREIVGEVQQLVKLQEMEARRPPPLFGREQQAPGDAERHLRQQVNEAKRKGGFVVTDPVRQGKTALGQAKTTVRHWLADRQEEIRTGKRIVGKRTVMIPDQELLALRRTQAEVRELWQATFPKPGRTDAQRLAGMERVYDRMIAEMGKDIEAGGIRSKLLSKVVTSPDLEAKKATYAALKAQREELRANNPAYRATVQARQDAAYKRSLTRRLADLQARRAKMLATGKIPAKKTVRERKLDKEAENLSYQLDQERGKVRVEVNRIIRANRPLWQKMISWGVAEPVSLARALKTSIDFSAVLFQGGLFVAGHPVQGFKKLGPMFRAAYSRWAEFGVTQEMRADPGFRQAQKAGLSITLSEGPLAQQEEMYMSELASKIPGIAHSQRAFTAYLNNIRLAGYNTMMASAERGLLIRAAKRLGLVTGEPTLAEAKVIANFMNTWTGRGSLSLGRWGSLEGAAVALNRTLFSARLQASRFQILYGQPMWSGTARTRILVAQEYARSLIGIAAFYGVVSLARAAWPRDDEEHRPRIEWSPVSADAGKVIMGETRIDPLMGLSQVIVMQTRVISGKTKTHQGKIVALRGPKKPYGGQDTLDVIARFARSKLSPAGGLIANVATQETFIGGPVTFKGEVANLTVPMAMQDIYQLMKEQRVPPALALSILAIFGLRVNTYQPRPKKSFKAY